MYRAPNFKYIVVSGQLGPEMIIFSEASTHKEVAHGKHVISAGFLLLEVDDQGRVEAQCYGKSVSLGGIESRQKEDSALARTIFRNEGKPCLK